MSEQIDQVVGVGVDHGGEWCRRGDDQGVWIHGPLKSGDLITGRGKMRRDLERLIERLGRREVGIEAGVGFVFKH